MPKLSVPLVPLPLFVELLAQDTTAELPLSPKNCLDILPAMRSFFVPPASSSHLLFCGRRRCVTTRVPPFIMLPDGHPRLLLAGLQLDAKVLNTRSWNTAIARRAAAFMAPGQDDA